MDTTWWTRPGDRRHGRQASCLADPGDDARPLDAGWTTLRRAAAVWATSQPGQLSSKDYQDGPGHRRDCQLRVLLRRPVGARRTAVVPEIRMVRTEGNEPKGSVNALRVRVVSRADGMVQSYGYGQMRR